MCTVLLRLDPGAQRPILLGAVRDEFVERAWDPPARHWPGGWSHLVGGRDQVAGGTWLAVDARARGVAAVLNAGRREDDGAGPRPTRGTLALRVLADEGLPEDLSRYDRFHLLRATLDVSELWSWDGDDLSHQVLPPGDHIIVNAGLDTHTDPLVPHFAPLLAATPSDPSAWIDLLAGDGLDPDDDRALLVRKEVEGRRYGSTSASLVALSPDEVRYEFTATPAQPAWFPVDLGEAVAL
jgi:uncharacterized protein with NRDE domain